MQGGRIDKQKAERGSTTIARQVANSRMAILNSTFTFATDVYSYAALQNFGQRTCAFSATANVPGQSSPSEPPHDLPLGAQRALDHAVIVKDRRIKLALIALGTARVDLATCGPVLARWLEALLGALSRPHL